MAEGENGLKTAPYQQQPTVVVAGGRPNYGLWMIGGGLLLGATAIGLVWALSSKGVTENLQDYSIQAYIVNPILPRGGLAEVEVIVKNESEVAQSPVFRLDMEGTGIFESWVEGSPQNVGSIAPGETVDVVIGYRLPADWGAGKQLNAQLMLIGIEGPVWNVNAGFVIQSDIEDGVIDVVSVVPTDSSLIVGATQKAEVEVTVSNESGSDLVRTFRLDLKGNNKATWLEGGDKLVSLPPGTSVFKLNRSVPTDWTEDQSPIAVKIQDIGEDGPIWGDVDGSDEYRIFTLLNEGADFQNEDNLIVTTKTPENGLISNGDAFSVTMDVTYKGGGAFLFGAGLKDGSEDGVWATAEAFLPSSTEWATVSIRMTGVFNSTLGSGRSIDMIKAVQTIGGPLNINGKDMIKADWDRDVYIVR